MALTKVVKRMEEDLRAIRRDVELKQRAIMEKKQMLSQRKNKILAMKDDVEVSRKTHQQYLATAAVLEENIDGRKLDIANSAARITQKTQDNQVYAAQMAQKKAIMEAANKKMEGQLLEKRNDYQSFPKCQELAALEAERFRLKNLLKVLQMKEQATIAALKPPAAPLVPVLAQVDPAAASNGQPEEDDDSPEMDTTQEPGKVAESVDNQEAAPEPAQRSLELQKPVSEILPPARQEDLEKSIAQPPRKKTVHFRPESPPKFNVDLRPSTSTDNNAKRRAPSTPAIKSSYKEAAQTRTDMPPPRRTSRMEMPPPPPVQLVSLPQSMDDQADDWAHFGQQQQQSAAGSQGSGARFFGSPAHSESPEAVNTSFGSFGAFAAFGGGTQKKDKMRGNDFGDLF